MNVWDDKTEVTTKGLWRREDAPRPHPHRAEDDWAQLPQLRRDPQEAHLAWKARREMALTWLVWMAFACATILTSLSATLLLRVVSHP